MSHYTDRFNRSKQLQENNFYSPQSSSKRPSILVYIQSVVKQHVPVPSSSALFAVLWMPRSFSPPLSICQILGCESFQCSRFLQPKAAIQQNDSFKYLTKIRTIVWVDSTLVNWMNLPVFNFSKDALKVLEKQHTSKIRDSSLTMHMFL